MESNATKTKLYATKDLTIDGAKYPAGSIVGEVEHVAALDKLLAGLHTGAVSTAPPDTADVGRG